MIRVLAIAALIAGCATPARVWTGRTPDRQHVLEIRREAGLDHVLVDGVRRAAYRGIAAWSIALANEHVAFAARVGGAWVVVRDGHVERARWDGIGELRFADDGTLVYIAERAGGWHVVRGGTIGPRHTAILAGTLRLAGRHVAYVAQDGARARVVVDGTPHETFDGIAQLVLHADGRVAYAGRRGLDVHAVIDGVVSRAYAQVTHLTLGASRAAYAVSVDREVRIVIDGELGTAVDEVRAIALGATHVAWVGRIGTLDVLSLDDKPVAAWPARRDLKFALRADDVLAYVAPVAGGERVIANDHAGPIFDEVRTPMWGPRGLAYAARRGSAWFVVDADRELPAGDAVGDPVIAARRLAFGGQRGTRGYVCVDGRTYMYDLVFTDTVAFSRDGKHWGAIVGDRARERLHIVIDGTHLVPIEVAELYASAASGSTTALVEWTRAELERYVGPSSAISDT